jgi:hypothetical protein
MVHYKCDRCHTVNEAEEELRGKEHVCVKCGALNIVPGGAERPRHLHHEHEHRRNEEEEQELDVKEPLTVGKVLKGLLWLVLATAIGGTLYYFLRPSDGINEAKIAAEAFVPHLAEYLQIDGLKPDAASLAHEDYRVLKAVLVNQMDEQTMKVLRDTPNVVCPEVTRQDDGSWAGINWKERARLPDRIRADKPEDVRTIVWIKWSLLKAGRAREGKSARRFVCDITLIDTATSLIVGKSTLRGSTPTIDKDSPNVVIGTRPTTSIVDHLSKWGSAK